MRLVLLCIAIRGNEEKLFLHLLRVLGFRVEGFRVQDVGGGLGPASASPAMIP